jgi:hypothetical protein
VRRWSTAIALLALLTPGVAAAHGTELMGAFLTIPLVPVWAIVAHINATPRVGPDERSRLGVMSPLAALAGMAWAFIEPAAFAGNASFASVLAPFGLSIAAGPAAAYLYGRGHRLRAALLVGVPILNCVACGMVS